MEEEDGKQGGARLGFGKGIACISRKGELVGKVVISKVSKDRSIADIVPSWQLGEIMEGDVVTPAHPASS